MEIIPFFMPKHSGLPIFHQRLAQPAEIGQTGHKN